VEGLIWVAVEVAFGVAVEVAGGRQVALAVVIRAPTANIHSPARLSTTNGSYLSEKRQRTR